MKPVWTTVCEPVNHRQSATPVPSLQNETNDAVGYAGTAAQDGAGLFVLTLRRPGARRVNDSLRIVISQSNVADAKVEQGTDVVIHGQLGDGTGPLVRPNKGERCFGAARILPFPQSWRD